MESKSIWLTSLLLAFNYDAPGQTGLFFSFETSFFRHCLSHTMRLTVECLKFQKLFFDFYKMSEAWSTAVENVVLFSKDCIVIKLPVTVLLCWLRLHSHQKLCCLQSDVSYFSTVSLPMNQEKSTPLLRQLKFWCDCSIRQSLRSNLSPVLMFHPCNLTRWNENMTIRSPIPSIITILTTDARQPWTDLQGCYSGYLIVYFNYLIIFLIIWLLGTIKQISTCSVNVISTPGNHFVTFWTFPVIK